jgi:hypothetical protein
VCEWVSAHEAMPTRLKETTHTLQVQWWTQKVHIGLCVWCIFKA